MGGGLAKKEIGKKKKKKSKNGKKKVSFTLGR